jgi:hypothetical protein
MLAVADASVHLVVIGGSTHNMPGPFDDAMAGALADLGVEDEGRVT